MIVGGVPFDDVGVRNELAYRLDLLRVALDDDVRRRHLLEFLCNLPTGPAGTAHDDVVLHLGDLFQGPAPPEHVLQVELDDERCEIREPEPHPCDAPEEQEHREDALGTGEVPDLLVAHRRKGDDGHEKGVRDVAPFDEDVSACPDDDQRHQEDQGPEESRENTPISRVVYTFIVL